MGLLSGRDSARPSHSVADESPATHSAELLQLKFELILNLGYCDLLFGMLYSPASHFAINESSHHYQHDKYFDLSLVPAQL